ncbi:sulfotransferase domain-containing protein [Salinibacter ruber]|uniref:sulfotransferase domain-containing protein n=1 Tax=Salinibacter ruber TaxID=146919 RepID=UPI00207336B9|nr:sulfotransferase [Salinibacter ruber]
MSIMPDFFVAGVPKGGTTSLYNDLRAHPEICMSDPKETWYFFDHRKYQRDLEWYASTFFDECREEQRVGEATPGYMAHPEAASRIDESGISAQFIFLLRDPAERAYSQFYFDIQRGVRDPSRSFSEVIRDPEEKTAHPDQNYVGLLEVGKYIDHLKRYERHFGRAQLLPLLFCDYVDKQAYVLQQIFDFLSIKQMSVTPSGRRNSTEYPVNPTLFSGLKKTWVLLQEIARPVAERLSPVRDRVRSFLLSSSQERPSMEEADRAYLRDFYADSNAALREYLDRDLSHWV